MQVTMLLDKDYCDLRRVAPVLGAVRHKGISLMSTTPPLVPPAQWWRNAIMVGRPSRRQLIVV